MSSERQEDSTNNPWWAEHIHRYQEAEKLLNGKGLKILDIACGNGFGSNFLAESGHDVIGADLSEEAVKACTTRYQNQRLQFKVCDGTNLPFKNEFFDAIVSFETIEHTAAFNEMLNEFKRVLKKDGLIFISTPNKTINSPEGVIINPFHTQEWEYEGLKTLLSSHFESFELMGQAFIRYSDKKHLRYSIGYIIEKLFYTRGIRKLPISFQDAIMKLIINEPIYPIVSNFKLVSRLVDIMKCKTFFAICKLK